MKKSIMIFAGLLIAFAGWGQIPFDLKTGDILFQRNRQETSFVRAIMDVTTSIEDLNFTHIGVVLVERDSVFVLEATMPRVCKTPLEKFFKQSKQINGNPMVVVGRLKPRYHKSIPAAIEYMKSLVGKPYDYVFLPDNDAYYCSEIIQLAFRNRRGKFIFKTQPMSFIDKATGETSELWIKHFERHKTAIPEGVEGTSPGEMSHSKILRIVHHYFDL